MKICFYSRLKEDWYFDLVDFYSNDIKIFKELGHEVKKVNNWRKIPSDCDLYFIWWWSSGVVPLLKAKLLGKPVITIGNIHYNDPSKQGYLQRPFYIKWFIKYSLKNSDLQIATSKIEYESIKKLGAKNPMLLYHAIDERKYTFNSYENRENFLLTLTQFTKENIQRKKVREIILAFKKVLLKYDDLLLYVVGNKSDNGYIDLFDFVKENNMTEKVLFLGRVNDKEKIELYRKCKMYVQPTSFEGFGMAIAESMLCGAPVITSKTGAVPEVVGDVAIYVNPDSIDEIANTIIKLLNDKNLSSEMGKRGCEQINNNFSYNLRKEKIKLILEKYGS